MQTMRIFLTIDNSKSSSLRLESLNTTSVWGDRTFAADRTFNFTGNTHPPYENHQEKNMTVFSSDAFWHTSEESAALIYQQ